mmetsp:Transcript_13371/g.31625  ORF Transcript_13371/g.31625 Transcript_13371/m.31625 type:complete len:88 (+) Transcript_13371:81-344(+)
MMIGSRWNRFIPRLESCLLHLFPHPMMVVPTTTQNKLTWMMFCLMKLLLRTVTQISMEIVSKLHLESVVLPETFHSIARSDLCCSPS